MALFHLVGVRVRRYCFGCEELGMARRHFSSRNRDWQCMALCWWRCLGPESMVVSMLSNSCIFLFVRHLRVARCWCHRPSAAVHIPQVPQLDVSRDLRIEEQVSIFGCHIGTISPMCIAGVLWIGALQPDAEGDVVVVHARFGLRQLQTLPVHEKFPRAQ